MTVFATDKLGSTMVLVTVLEVPRVVVLLEAAAWLSLDVSGIVAPSSRVIRDGIKLDDDLLGGGIITILYW